MPNKNFENILETLEQEGKLLRTSIGNEEIVLQFQQFIESFKFLYLDNASDEELLGMPFYEVELLIGYNQKNSSLVRAIAIGVMSLNLPQADKMYENRMKFIPKFYQIFFTPEEMKTIALHQPKEWCDVYQICEEMKKYGRQAQVQLYIIRQLKEYENNGGTNSQRISTTRIIEKLVEIGAPIQLIFGVLYLELEIASPNFWKKGTRYSQMHDIISGLFKNLKNPNYPNKSFNEYDPLTFLTMLNLFLNKQLPDLSHYQTLFQDYMNGQTHLTWTSYADFCKSVKENLQITIENESKKMDEILRGSFQPDYLLQEIDALLTSQEGKQIDAKEEEAIMLLKIISQHSKEKMKFYESAMLRNDNNDQEQKLIVNGEIFGIKKVLLGTLLYILTNVVTKSDRDIHSRCLKMGNFKSLNDIPAELSSNWLSALSVEMDKLNQTRLINHPSQNMERIIQDIEKLKKIHEAKKESNAEWWVSKLTQTTIYRGLGFFGSTSIVVGILSFLGTTIPSATGPVGCLVYVGGYWVVKYIGEQAVPEVVRNGWDMVANSISERAGAFAGPQLVENTRYYFTATQDNLTAVIERLANLQNEIDSNPNNWNVKDWIESYRALPDELFPEAKKSILEKLFLNSKTNEIDESLVQKAVAMP